jgi:hypothetical protein
MTKISAAIASAFYIIIPPPTQPTHRYWKADKSGQPVPHCLEGDSTDLVKPPKHCIEDEEDNDVFEIVSGRLKHEFVRMDIAPGYAAEPLRRRLSFVALCLNLATGPRTD